MSYNALDKLISLRKMPPTDRDANFNQVVIDGMIEILEGQAEQTKILRELNTPQWLKDQQAWRDRNGL